MARNAACKSMANHWTRTTSRKWVSAVSTWTVLDLARQATTYAEGLFWLYLRKSDLDGMLKVVKLMQLEFKESRNE